MKKTVSSGGIVVSNNQILLITFPVSFSKGHVEPGESLEQTAIREVQEETGLKNPKIIKKIGMLTRKSTEDWDEEVMKNIHLFLMNVENLDQEKVNNESKWVPFDYAISHMYFPEESDFLKLNRDEILNLD